MRVRTEARREAILETATQVFMELGYERASMAEIATRTGGSKATLYGYFASKEELFKDVILHKVGKPIHLVIDDLPSQADEDPRIVLQRLGETFLQAILTPEAIALKPLLLAQHVAQSDLARQTWEQGPQRLFSGLENYLKEATTADRLRIDNPQVAARQLMALYQAEMDERGPFLHKKTILPYDIPQMVTRAVYVFLAAYG